MIPIYKYCFEKSLKEQNYFNIYYSGIKNFYRMVLEFVIWVFLTTWTIAFNFRFCWIWNWFYYKFCGSRSLKLLFLSIRLLFCKELLSWLPFNFDSCGLDNWYLITVGNTLEADVFFVNDNFGQSVRGYFLRLWIKLVVKEPLITF